MSYPNDYETVGTDTPAALQTKDYGFNLGTYLIDAQGNVTTIAGTPTVDGVNCTVTYLTKTLTTVYVRMSAAKGARMKGAVRTQVTLANGEVVPLQILVEFV